MERIRLIKLIGDVQVDEEPQKGIQDQTSSDVESSPKSWVVDKSKGSKNSENKESKKAKEFEDSSKKTDTIKNPQRRFRDFLAWGDIDPTVSSPQSENTSHSSKGTSEKTKNTDKDNSSSDSHYFNQEFLSFDFSRKLRSNKEQGRKIIGAVVGSFFIIIGLIYMLGSSVRVADNVVSGERVVISAFLILVGVLIMAAAFAHRLLEKSFLKNIHSELAETEKLYSEKKSQDKKEKQKDNIDEMDKK
ncbi:MAG: CvpA family protein [Methanobacterium sp.]|uniref:CvpA family protein n=1 Tax=Methanobacterium sp. TaxID=2164 RepID=UPI003D8DD272